MSETFIFECIDKIAVGKNGARNIPPEHIEKLCLLIENHAIHPNQLAVIIAGLIVKGFAPHEIPIQKILPDSLFSSFEVFCKYMNISLDARYNSIFNRLLSLQELEISEAQIIGDLLFTSSETPQFNPARVLAATILRMRYSTALEYAALYDSMMKRIKMPVYEKKMNRCALLAEPFDGSTRSYLYTPLISRLLIKNNIEAISLVGDSSGPKFGLNLKMLATEMKLNFLNTTNAAVPDSAFGSYLDVFSLSEEFSAWSNLRKQIYKRPFMATLEKFPRVFNADILILSAFHGNYPDKMIETAIHAGYSAVFVVHHGREGLLSFSVSKPVEVFYSLKNAQGKFISDKIIFSANSDLPDSRIANLNAAQNAALIRQYASQSMTDNTVFNTQADATLNGMQSIIKLIKAQDL